MSTPVAQRRAAPRSDQVVAQPLPAATSAARAATRDPFDLAWAFFTSTKLALALMLTIAVACLAGALVMQAPSEILGSPDAVQTWVERARPRYGSLTDAFRTLGVFWLFQTVWFRTLIGLLAVNTTICTINRLPSIWQAVFRPARRPADGLFERGIPREAVVLRGRDEAAGSALLLATLRAAGYRAIATPEPESQTTVFYADRFRIARFGTLLTHAGLVLVMVGAVLGGPMGAFEEPGFAVPVGSTRAVGHDTALSIRVEDFADEYHPDGRPKDYRSEAVLLDDGREVARQTIRVNEPLVYNGVRFHQAYYGQAALVLATTPGSGQELFRDAVSLTWRGNDGLRPVGYFYLPSANLHVYLVGTAGEDDPLIHPGELMAEAYRGQATTPTYRVTLAQRQPLALGPDVELRFDRELPFTGLRVVRNPSVPIIWLASTMLVLGIALTFYFPHRRLWARVRVVGDRSAAELVLVGAGREMAEPLRQLAERLGAKHHASATGSAPRHRGARAIAASILDSLLTLGGR